MKTRKIVSGVMGGLAALLVAAPSAADDFLASLHPLHPGREAVEEPAFEGKWVYSDSSGPLLEVQKTEDGYMLRLFSTNEREEMWFRVHLVRLSGIVFADIQQTSNTEIFLLNPHVFAKLRVDQDALHFNFLEDGYVKTALEDGRTNLAHEWMESTLVLRAPTRELQDFVQSCAFDDQAWDEDVCFTRLKQHPGNTEP